jgi:type IV secretion system protein TrbL
MTQATRKVGISSISLMALLSAMLLVTFPESAIAATANAGPSGILQDFSNVSGSWAGKAETYGMMIFGVLATIEFAWTWILYILEKGGGEDDPFPILIRKILSLGFFYWILINGPMLLGALIGGFIWLAQNIGAMNGTTTPVSIAGHVINILSPGWIFQQGVAIAAALDKSAMAHTSIWHPINTTFISLVVGLAMLVVIAAFAIIAANIIITLIEAFIVVGAGLVFLGFGGSRWTLPFMEKYIGYAVSIGVKLFVLYLVVAFGSQLSQTWLTDASNAGGDAATYFTIGLDAVIYLFIAWKVPDFASSLMNGTPQASLGGAMQTVGGLAMAGAGTAAALATGGAALGAMGSGAAGLAKGVAGGLAGAGGNLGMAGIDAGLGAGGGLADVAMSSVAPGLPGSGGSSGAGVGHVGPDAQSSGLGGGGGPIGSGPASGSGSTGAAGPMAGSGAKGLSTSASGKGNLGQAAAAAAEEAAGPGAVGGGSSGSSAQASSGSAAPGNLGEGATGQDSANQDSANQAATNTSDAENMAAEEATGAMPGVSDGASQGADQGATGEAGAGSAAPGNLGEGATGQDSANQDSGNRSDTASQDQANTADVEREAAQADTVPTETTPNDGNVTDLKAEKEKRDAEKAARVEKLKSGVKMVGRAIEFGKDAQHSLPSDQTSAGSVSIRLDMD